ncbi:zinc finger, C3HC4 type (RING finger) domain-containing protein [Cryptosporidium felis]|nr:zinc finger, C3HC4 type (RING finger) domain-containing protein [Cryptosporidium felis]
MEFNLHFSRRGGNEENYLVAREFQGCSSGYPVSGYQGGIEGFGRPYTPLRDITGSIFGSLVRESQLRSLQRSGGSVGERSSVLNRSPVNLVGGGSESRFFGGRPTGGYAVGGARSADLRTFNRSLSMSSPDLNLSGGFFSGIGGGTEEAVENNSSYLNRSRSFADRILEQFETVEREHNRLAERINRSRSIYEQIQRNGVEAEQLFNSISGGMERRHTTGRDASAGDFGTRTARPVFGVTNSSQRSRYSGDRATFGPLGNCHFGTVGIHEVEPTTDYDDESGHENDVIEVIHVDDEDFSEMMARRSADIRNRSLVIEREEISFEDSLDEEEYEDQEDNQESQGEEEIIEGGDDGFNGVTDHIRNRIDSVHNELSGVPIEIQNALPVSRFDHSRSHNLDDDKKMCLICLDEFKDKQEILWLPCTHCFCKDCIVSWFERGTVCPICKDDLMAHFE